MDALNALPEIDYDGVMQLKWQLLKLIYAENGKKDLATAGFKKFLNKMNTGWFPIVHFPI